MKWELSCIGAGVLFSSVSCQASGVSDGTYGTYLSIAA